MTRTRHSPFERAAGALAAVLLVIASLCMTAAGDLLRWIDRCQVTDGRPAWRRMAGRVATVVAGMALAVAAAAVVLWLIS